MAQFVAYNKDAEVNGATIMSLIKGMAGFEASAQKILEKYGIRNVNENDWYPQQSWLNAFKEISEKIGAQTLITIGTKIIESAQWPPDVKNVEQALASVDIAYHMNHRVNSKVLFDPKTGVMQEGIGHYYFEKISNNEYHMTCDNPYPCDFDKGIIKGVVTRFKTATAKVEFFENSKVVCRKTGGNKCIHIIKVS
jgi:hypothetical protein